MRRAACRALRCGLGLQIWLRIPLPPLAAPRYHCLYSQSRVSGGYVSLCCIRFSDNPKADTLRASGEVVQVLT